MEDDFKKSVELSVQTYRNLYPDEYNFVVSRVAERRKQLVKNSKLIETKDISEVVERELNRYPETLYNMILVNLPAGGDVWFNSRDAARWFTKSYPEFALAEI